MKKFDVENKISQNFENERYVNRTRKNKWSLLLSRTSKPVVTPTTHEPGFFHNIKLNNLSIKELRSLRTRLEAKDWKQR